MARLRLYAITNLANWTLEFSSHPIKFLIVLIDENKIIIQQLVNERERYFCCVIADDVKLFKKLSERMIRNIFQNESESRSDTYKDKECCVGQRILSKRTSAE